MKGQLVRAVGASVVLAALCTRAVVVRAETQDGVRESVLRSIKAATVFIRVRSVGGEEGSGTGFLIYKKGNDGYLATSEHVVRHDGRNAGRITVVFNSGAPGEQSLDASVVGAHAASDIAILKVTSPAPLPEPIGFSSRLKVKETMPVLVLGFPFGKALSLTEGNPSVTIGQGTISSLRRDEAGRLEVIQVDGDLNPGNSGGPVVTRDGLLVGVSAATVLGTQIGLTVPALRTVSVLRGELDGMTYEAVSGDKQKVEIRVKLAFVDPLGRIEKATIYMTPREQVREAAKPDPESATGWTRLDPVGTRYGFDVRDGKATGKVTIPMKNAGKGVVVVQAAFQRGAAVVYSEPQEWDLGADAEFLAAAGVPPPPPGEDGGGWLGADTVPPSEVEKAKPLEVVEGNRVLYTKAKVVVDASVLPLDIESKNLAGDLLWSRNARHVYVLSKDGVLREISVPDLVERRLVKFDAPCTDIALSAEGLLVLCSGKQRAFVIDEKKLEVKGSIDVGGATRLTSAPDASVAFIGEGSDIRLADLNTRKIVATFNSHQVNAKYVKRIRRHQDGVVLSEFRMPRMSPDGRYLFCVGFECLHRLSLRGRELVYEEMGPRIGQNAQRIEFSGDAVYIALPSGGGNYWFADAPKVNYGTYVFNVRNLLKPVLTIASGHYPRCLGFDKVGKCIYAMNFDKQLLTFSPMGQKLREYVLTDRGDQTSQILVHPTGKKVLLRCLRLIWVEIDDGARAKAMTEGE